MAVSRILAVLLLQIAASIATPVLPVSSPAKKDTSAESELLGLLSLAQQAEHDSRQQTYDFVCKLLIRGHARSGSTLGTPTPADSDAAAPAAGRMGVAVGQLNCSRTAANSTSPHTTPWPTVVVNSSHLAQHSPAFQGVHTVSGTDSTSLCGSDPSNRWGNMPMFSLLSFCGNYSVLLDRPSIQDLLLPSPAGDGYDTDWDASILLFGGTVRAAVAGGAIINNEAGTPIIVAHQASLALLDSSITANSGAVWGGAVAVYDNGSLHVSTSACVNNQAHIGGCLYVETVAYVTVRKSSIVGNSALGNVADIAQFYGGGVYVRSAKVVLQSCNISSNAANLCGGVALSVGGSLALGDCSVFNNSAEGGGAMCSAKNSKLLLHDCSIFGNGASGGGAIYAKGNSTVLLAGTSCHNNTAVVGDGQGGCLFMLGNAAVHVSANSTISSNSAVQGGGVFLEEQAVLHVRGQVLNNEAHTFGGGGHFRENSTVVFAPGSKVSGNVAQYFGGGVSASGGAVVELLGASFSGNVAHRMGGGVAAYEGVVVKLLGASVTNNSAGTWGGGVCLAESAQLHVGRCSCVAGNMAQRDGAGVYAGDDGIVTITGCSSIFGNSAKGSGGGLRVFERAVLVVNGSFGSSCADMCGPKPVCAHMFDVLFRKPAAGKAAVADGDSTNAKSQACSLSDRIDLLVPALLSAHGPSIVANCAEEDGGGVDWYGYGSADAGSSLSNVYVAYNTAGKDGGCLDVSNSESRTSGGLIQLVNVTIAGCTASVGGGMWVGQPVTCTGHTLIANNTAVGDKGFGGGVAVGSSTGVLKLAGQTVVAYNSAGVAGGGLYGEGGATIELLDAAAVYKNSAPQGGGVAFVMWNGSYSTHSPAAVLDNAASLSKDVLVTPTTVSVLRANEPASSSSNNSIISISSTLSRDTGLISVAVLVSGYHGLPVEGALVSSMLNDTELAGGFNKTNASGIAAFHNLKLQQKPGLYNITFHVLDWTVTLPPAYLLVRVRHCVAGEVTRGYSNVCEPCERDRYSLNPSNASCDECPAGCNCSGGAVLLPKPGWWHSAPSSPQMHRCRNPAACTGLSVPLSNCSSATEAAEAGATSSSESTSSCNRKTPNSTAWQSMQCAEGYTGHLCGECAAGWGQKQLFTCRKCMPTSTILVVYLFVGVAMLAVVKLIAWFQMKQNLSSIGTSSYDSTDTVLGPADVLKSLVLYSQYLVIVASMQVDWPSMIAQPLQALQWFWSSSSAQTLSLECVLGPVAVPDLLPVSIQRLLVYLGAPVVIYVLLVLLAVAVRAAMARCGVCNASSTAGAAPAAAGCCLGPIQCCQPFCHAQVLLSRLSDRSQALLPLGHVCSVMGLAMVFVFLPSLSRTVFSLFVCIRIDDPLFTPYAYTAAANGTYWAYDLSAQCWSGYHKGWALGLGLPLALLLCVGLPGAIAALMWSKRKQLLDPQFCSRFGFIYSSYKPARCAWEAVVVVQTNVLVAVAVFGLRLGAYFHALVMNAALAVDVLLLLMFKPYKSQQLYMLRLNGMGVLLLTSYACLTFLPVYTYYREGVVPTDAYRVAIGVVVLVVNLAYVVYGVVLLVRSVVASSLLMLILHKLRTVVKLILLKFRKVVGDKKQALLHRHTGCRGWFCVDAFSHLFGLHAVLRSHNSGQVLPTAAAPGVLDAPAATDAAGLPAAASISISK